MAYYDAIAKQWHQVTGYRGGAFKRYVLNDILLEQMDGIQDKAVLEIGAGNGYFMAWVMDRFSGQTPARLVITDISDKLLTIAQKQFHLPQSKYLRLDVRGRFPFSAAEFDLVVATMVFNELTNGGARRGLAEIRRVLRTNGVFLLTVTHPDFIDNLQLRGVLQRDRQGLYTMPGAQSLRLPIVRRSREKYEALLTEAGFAFQAMAIAADDRVFNEKPGLRAARGTPLGLLFRCVKQ